MSINAKLVNKLLNELEAEEARLLAWGYVDGGFSEEEIVDRAERFCEKHELDIVPDDLVTYLWERKLLFELPIHGRTIWRTRMAETIRLMVRLRQLFPKIDWQVATTLVSDFRFTRSERRYPKRNISVEETFKRMEKHLSDIEKSALAALLRPGFQLSEFQVKASSRMLQDLKDGKSRGMIVCAGTGTGKSLCFYLPALTHISILIIRKPGYWTKGLALYPRNELLKDQFIETYQEARRLDKWLQKRIGRKLRIGCFFGLTPKNINDVRESWERHSFQDGYICPYMNCPKCSSSLLWMEDDLKAKREILRCSNGECTQEISGDEVSLTRDQMKNYPPDLLFTTTEMLNRSMSDLRFRKVFGINAHYSPEIMLLDEVHTYTGVHGAQVAYLLRRWRHAVKKPIHFTGLSATLKEAGEFFSQLIGLHRSQIEEIRVGEDLESEGQEYQLILRGDPVSGTSLLSTTIQSTMLLRRMLDLPKEEPSGDLFGEKVFVFTDDLDVTNRLYHNLLDAEGLTSWGEPKLTSQPLAVLRQHYLQQADKRLEYGQSWYCAEQIGHVLDQPLLIGRTSSQDSGVSNDADVIVATASLEVGYSDPRVGAVIQHKAPLDMASFLQRKGRAGRKRGTRPWTITILSDYGRDRLMYQQFETLFNPVLEHKSLPIRNRYVLKMQAVYCLMDWMSEEVRKKSKSSGSLWYDLSARSNSPKTHNRQLVVMEVIKKLLQSTSYRNQFEIYLQRALQLLEEELKVVLWDTPRSLMFHVLPTLLRRLDLWIRDPKELEKLNWNIDKIDKDGKFNYPLPEFISSNLFSDLNLPEIEISLPPLSRGKQLAKEAKPELMPLLSALNLFAPGRVTRRFGIKMLSESHWIAPPSLIASQNPQPLYIDKFCESYDVLGDYQVEIDGEIRSITCIRPWELKVEKPDQSVMTTSNARLIWKSQIFPTETGDLSKSMDDQNYVGSKVEPPDGTPWQSLFKEIQFYIHNLHSTVTVRRFALGSNAVVKRKQQRKLDLQIEFYDKNDNPVTLGFSLEVDGICFRYQLPKGAVVELNQVSPSLLRAWRTAYFHYRLMQEKRLDGIADVFDRERLSEVYLAVLSTYGMKNKKTIQEAYLDWRSTPNTFVTEMDKVFQVCFRDNPESELEQFDSEVDEGEQLQRVHQLFLEICSQKVVQEVLHELAHVLWEDPDEKWHRWMVERWQYTLGGALLQACKEIASESQNSDIILDVGGGPRPLEMEPLPEDVGEIWITETSIGGCGVIEEIMHRYHEDPRRFFRLVESALDPSELELINSELTRCLEEANTDDEMKSLLNRVRQADSYERIEPAIEDMRRFLQSKGILVTQSVLASIYNRILRPGSSKDTDKLMHKLITMWKQEEERLGIELDVRIFSHVSSVDQDLLIQFQNVFQQLDPSTVSNAHWRFQVIYSLLWPRGYKVRARALESYNPFVQDIVSESDREIIRTWLSSFVKVKQIDLTEENWEDKAAEELTLYGSVHLTASLSKVNELRQALLKLVATPLEMGFLHVYPRLEGIRREGNRLVANLDVREVIQ